MEGALIFLMTRVMYVDKAGSLTKIPESRAVVASAEPADSSKNAGGCFEGCRSTRTGSAKTETRLNVNAHGHASDWEVSLSNGISGNLERHVTIR